VETFTKPSRDVTMRFSFPTEIREVAVVGGQRVKAGELLIRARDAEIKAALDVQKLRAGTDLEVKAAEANLELAKFRYSNLLDASKRGSGTPTELEERRIEQRQAELTLDQAKIRLDEAQLLVQQAEGRYETYRLDAPFDGVVEEVMVDVGQGVNEQMPAIRVVNTEKLWLDAFPRTGETVELGLKEGSPAWVLLDLHGGGRLAEGKVLYVSPVADSVSLTRRVRVEITNAAGLPAGTQSLVRFTAPDGEWPRVGAEAEGVASRGAAEDAR
jgi:multidrug efflux pump subunit AcrA (membrane-fusion protein)